MAVVHGKTTAGSVVPLKVAADGTLEISGEVEVGDITLEAGFGGIPEHWNGTATDVADTITFGDTSRSIMFDNLGVANNLLFSLDGGTKWKTLGPESSINVVADRDTIKVKCASGETTDYEMIVVVAE